MSQRRFSFRLGLAVAGLALLSACSQTAEQRPVASNPPLHAPGPNASWYTVSFDNNSFAVDPAGQKVVNEVVNYLKNNPTRVATIVGRTDDFGTADYNMHLSHQRADAVRDALVYSGRIGAERIETRWTGETRQVAATGYETAATANRVVDIAIH